MTIPTLQSERLVLRPFRQNDLDAYAAICADPEVMRFLGGKTMDRGDTWRHMAMILGHWQLRGFGLWAVERRDNGALVGRIGSCIPRDIRDSRSPGRWRGRSGGTGSPPRAPAPPSTTASTSSHTTASSA